ncbi:unnamed protein product, partial [marine sediment metagenome]
KGDLTPVWEGEGDEGSEADPEFDLLEMQCKKMLLLHAFSSELAEDAAADLAAIMVWKYARAVAKEEDRIGFLGDGSGGSSASGGYAKFVGVLGAAANGTYATANSTCVPHLVTEIATHDLTTEITEAKLREMGGKLQDWADEGAEWYMHRTVQADLDGIQKGTAGGSVVAYADPRSPKIGGYPINHANVMPKSPSAQNLHVLALGDL